MSFKKKLGAFFILALAAFFILKQRSTSLPDKAVDTLKKAEVSTNKAIEYKSTIYKDVQAIRNEVSPSAPPVPQNDREKARDLFYDAMKVYGSNRNLYEKYLHDALSLDPANVDALGSLAGSYLNQGNKSEARKFATECIARDRANKTCHTALISSFTRYGEFDEAYAYLMDCLQEDSDNIQCLGGIETYYINKGLMSEAKGVLDKINQLEPDSLWTYLALAKYFDAIGDRSSAITYFEKACEQEQPYACTRVKQLAQN